jgi:RNA polymerase sigma-70 factor, ECF subfamily
MGVGTRLQYFLFAPIEGFPPFVTISYRQDGSRLRASDVTMRDEKRVRQAEVLPRAVLAGDQNAWRMLYDSAHAELWAYAVWRCAGLRDLAEEVTQETWLVAVRRFADYDPQKRPFLAWLRGIAAKVVQTMLRERGKRQSICDTEIAEPAPDADPAEWIALALAALPEHYEAVLRTKYLEGSRVEEIAAAWSTTPKSIESLLTRARQAFREVYERLAGNDIACNKRQP